MGLPCWMMPLTRSPLAPFSAQPTIPRSVHDHSREKEGLLAVLGLLNIYFTHPGGVQMCDGAQSPAVE